MYNFNYMMGGGASFPHIFAPFIALLVVWSLFWKGLSLWHSARKIHPWWFVILLFVNTGGILDIIYIFGVAKLKIVDLFTKK